MLTDKHVAQLNEFLERIERDTYPEPPTPGHTQITEQMLEALLTAYPLAPGSRVLDVGCGQGVALELFQQRGFEATGVALGDEDVRAATAKGLRVFKMDQSFLDFEDDSFELIWSRHCLEHSIFPYFTLWGMRRVLKPGGGLYVEVPAPETSCKHETNPNHYSVLPHGMWRELFERSGFDLLEAQTLDLTTSAGPDTYWAFFMQLRADGAGALHPDWRD